MEDSASDGRCDDGCGSGMLGLFLVVIGVGLFLIFTLQIPNVIITIRYTRSTFPLDALLDYCISRCSAYITIVVAPGKSGKYGTEEFASFVLRSLKGPDLLPLSAQWSQWTLYHYDVMGGKIEQIHENMCKQACYYVSYKKTTSKHIFSCIFSN